LAGGGRRRGWRWKGVVGGVVGGCALPRRGRAASIEISLDGLGKSVFLFTVWACWCCGLTRDRVLRRLMVIIGIWLSYQIRRSGWIMVLRQRIMSLRTIAITDRICCLTSILHLWVLAIAHAHLL
jgi:hypothetical protein